MIFLQGDKYTNEVKNILSKSKKLKCAVAFWGKDSEIYLKEHTNNESRFICNLKTGATNPDAIDNLRRKINIKNNSTLHAKVYIGDDKIIIGSANISASGLSLEDDELKGWIEAGVMINKKDFVNKNDYKKLRENIEDWFDKLYSKSSKIDNDMINIAKSNWIKRRANRPLPINFISKAKNYDILEVLKNRKLSDQLLKDKPIYVAITNEPYSKEAKAKGGELKKRDKYDSNREGYLEDWNLPPSSHIIFMYKSPRRGTGYVDTFTIYKTYDKSDNKKYTLDNGDFILIMNMPNKIEGFKNFSNFKWQLKRKAQEIIKKNNNKPILKSLYELREEFKN